MGTHKRLEREAEGPKGAYSHVGGSILAHEARRRCSLREPSTRSGLELRARPGRVANAAREADFKKILVCQGGHCLCPSQLFELGVSRKHFLQVPPDSKLEKEARKPTSPRHALELAD